LKLARAHDVARYLSFGSCSAKFCPILGCQLLRPPRNPAPAVKALGPSPLSARPGQVRIGAGIERHLRHILKAD
jgi:hypothetical protein